MRFALRASSLLLAVLLHAVPAGALQLRVAAHMHSTYSQVGVMPLADMAAKAHEKKLDALIFSDHLLAEAEYGLWPLREIIKVRVNRASVLKAGTRNYLDDIDALRRKYPDMLFVPGVEAAAYYRWSGSPLDKLTMHDWNRHLIIAGLENPSDYRRMPAIGHSGGAGAQTLFFFLLVPAGFGLRRSGLRRLGTIAVVLGVLGTIGAYPYRNFSWSQYLPSTPWEPYNRLIDYAEGKNALVFWAHPAASNWANPVKLNDRVYAQTEPYPDCLEHSPDADGFAVFMEGRPLARPGAQWDKALLEYISGRRKKPVWAYAELDLVDFNSTPIDSSYMLADVNGCSVPELLGALKNGHFQSVANSASGRIEISTFTVSCGGAAAGEGEQVDCSAAPAVHMAITGGGQVKSAAVTLVRNGVALFSREEKLPADISVPATSGDAYYRLMAEQVNSAAYSNPVFVKEAK
jgi:hypothetical protein